MKRRQIQVMIQPLAADVLNEVMPIEEACHPIPWKRKMFEEEIGGNPFSYFYAARDPVDKSLLGFICFWLVFEEIRFMNLSVSPDHRRQGVAEQLVRWALEWGWERGARLATLEVRVSNEAARRLYEKLGFGVTGTRSGYYREPKEDALIMSRDGMAGKDRLKKQGGGQNGGRVFRDSGEASSEKPGIPGIGARAPEVEGRIKQIDST